MKMFLVLSVCLMAIYPLLAMISGQATLGTPPQSRDDAAPAAMMAAPGDEGFDVGDLPPPPEPLENWKEVLGSIEYDHTVVEITKVGVSGVVGLELGGRGWKSIHSAPEIEAPDETLVTVTDEAVRDAVKSSLLEIAEELTVNAGYAASFKDRVYSALVQHVREKFLNGSSLGLAQRCEIEFAWKMLPQVKSKVAGVPGLVGGIIEHGGQ